MKRCKDCRDHGKHRETICYPCRNEMGRSRPNYVRKRRLLFAWWIPKLLLLLAVLLGGCGVEVRYEDEQGRVFEYKRTGPQQIGEVLMELPDGSTFLMDGQKSLIPPIKVTLPNGIIIESGGKVVGP